MKDSYEKLLVKLDRGTSVSPLILRLIEAAERKDVIRVIQGCTNIQGELIMTLTLEFFHEDTTKSS